jgi:hypothetical protein
MIIPCAIVHPDKLMAAQLVKKFHALYETWRSINVFTSLLLVPILTQINPVHTTPSYYFRSILILSSHLCLGLQVHYFCKKFPPNFQYVFYFCLSLLHTLHFSSILI